jgi:hypothetical protein
MIIRSASILATSINQRQVLLSLRLFVISLSPFRFFKFAFLNQVPNDDDHWHFPTGKRLDVHDALPFGC